MFNSAVWMRAFQRNALALIAAAVLPITALASADHRPYGIVQRWTLPGTGGWDYLTLDAARHRLFITRGSRVEVIDTDSGKVVGRVPDKVRAEDPTRAAPEQFQVRDRFEIEAK